MKRNKYKDYLWYTAIAVFVICVLEGIFYYHSVESPFLKVMLNIQNAIKAYKIDPDIYFVSFCPHFFTLFIHYYKYSNSAWFVIFII